MASVLAAAAAFASLLVPPRAAAAQPQTVFVQRAPIAAFAQDGPYIAWFTQGRRGCNRVRVRSLRNGLQVALPSEGTRNVTCRFEPANGRVGLALAGTRALWALPQAAPLPLDYLLGASVASEAERRFQEVAHTTRGVGQWLGGIGGDGGTLAYAVTTVDYADEAGCLAGSGPCTLVRSGGGVYRISGRQRVRVPKTGPAVAVAVSAGAVAYVPTGGIGARGRPLPGADLPITIVDARSGEQIAAVLPQGVPLAIALSRHVLASLERTPLGLRVAWYRRATGAPLGSVPVPRRTAAALTANDRHVVFRVGRSIRTVDVATHRIRTLARTGALPIGLSLDGNWLRWAENRRGVGRIRALYVSGRG